MALRDGTRTIEIYRIADSNHSDTFLMVYLARRILPRAAEGLVQLILPPPLVLVRRKARLEAVARQRVGVGARRAAAAPRRSATKLSLT